ncbi:uncharacterized protein LOC103862531 [Brassica rapa]|uniref:Uncharacterized protein n=2 Tax=Brassica TaxID=3705 RepID=A0A3P6AJ81_BRACM|nr:uncharacterized protein LOC103862531 [Brassica rapa]XP_048623223.1 uncharacterized protein LOC106445503 [Brassica napus]CAF2133468.1 unnamed protein product [Brassica napus]CAG7885353.1 unnamed protein product [Brassica rapa]CDY29544.1 BnaA03g53890D [Brassica napus]VDC84348.1 unnamed protein product [Brassica rapa]
MRPFGLIVTVMFLVSAFSESRTADCRVLLGGSWEDQSKNHGVDLRSKELLRVVIRGYKRLQSLSSAGERMHTMASGPSRRGAGH